MLIWTIAACLLSVNALAASFQGLGDLPGGTFYSQAAAVSADGKVVVGTSQSSNGYEAFRWTAANGMIGLGDLAGGGFYSQGTGVSADGTVVVGSSLSPSGGEAFRWTQAAGVVGLGDLPGGSFYSEANAISADGLVVLGESSSTLCPTYYEAFRWNASNGMVAMGKLPGGTLRSYAFSVSADGSVIVGYSGSSNATSGTAEAFRWTAATGMVPLGDFPNGYFNSIAYGVSADGSVVVGRGYPNENGDEEAFRWTAQSGLVHLGFAPGDQSSSAFAVSADGNTIVGAVGNTSPVYALIWRPQWGMRHIQHVLTNDLGLNLTGWTLAGAIAVSEDGQTVVGYGSNPSGQTEAWIANLSPPSLAINQTGTNILLSWGTNTAGFVLEQTAQLDSGSVWSNVIAPVSVFNAQYVVTNGTTMGQKFFRLRRP